MWNNAKYLREGNILVLVGPETDCLRGGDFAGENF